MKTQGNVTLPQNRLFNNFSWKLSKYIKCQVLQRFTSINSQSPPQWKASLWVQPRTSLESQQPRREVGKETSSVTYKVSEEMQSEEKCREEARAAGKQEAGLGHWARGWIGFQTVEGISENKLKKEYQETWKRGSSENSKRKLLTHLCLRITSGPWRENSG